MNAAGTVLLKKFENELLSRNSITKTNLGDLSGLHASWDKIGSRWQIGYGHTGEYSTLVGMIHTTDHVTNGDYLHNEDEATQLLLADICIREHSLLPKLPSSLNINQTSSLTCLAYNVGVGAVLNSHLLQAIRAVDRFPLGGSEVLKDIERRWLSWDHGEVGGHEEVIAGLLSRRKAEWALFVTPLTKE